LYHCQLILSPFSFFFQAEDGIRDFHVTGVQTCALPIFRYLLYYFDPKITVSDLTSDAVLGYVRWMKDEKRLSPVTINIRIRTLRTFLRWLEREGYLSEPLHERLTKVREPDTEIDVLTPREIRKLLSVIDTNRYVGF